MRPAPLSRLIAAATLCLAALLPAVLHAERGPQHAASNVSEEDPNGARVIVKYKALGTLMRALSARTGGARGGPQMAAQLARRHSLVLSDGHIVNARTQVVFGDRTMSSAALAARLSADPDVEYAVPDLRRHALATPNDPLYGTYSGNPAPQPGTDTAIAVGQWYLHAPDSTFIAAIDALDAWSVTTGSSSLVVADIDTGVLFNHPDLAGKLLAGRNFFSGTGATGTGWSADASDPGDYTTANQCGQGVAAEPSSWHGTQTASIIGAATNNGVGMASVGYNVMVQPVRVLGACGGYDSDILAGMYWGGGLADPATGDPSVPANPTPAKVLNMSLGGTGTCTQAYTDAVAALNAAGVTVVVAAGNAEGLAVGVPGNCAGVIGVAGLRNVGTKVGYSSLGPQVAIAAPAGNCINTSGACLYPILTALNTGTTTPSSGVYSYSDSTNYSVGTSFATPMVTGTVALMLSVNPALTPGQIRSTLQSTARTFPTTSAGATTTVPQCQPPSSATQDECICTTSTCGAGMLSTSAAVQAAAQSAVPSVSVAASSSTVIDGTTVTLTGTATAATGKTIAGYQWTLTSGGSIATISGSSTAASVSVNTTGIGSFTAQLTVTDSSGLSASSSVTVTVNPPAPTASIVDSACIGGSACTVQAGGSVTLDGTNSSAGDTAQITGYQWSITSGNSIASFSGGTTGQTATVVTQGSASGSFTVQLTITDSLGRKASTTSTVTVAATGPTASIAASAASVVAGSNVTFDGSSSVAPTGRTIAGYLWSISSGGNVAAISGSASGSSITVATSAAGSFTVQLVVTDSAGATSTQTSTVTITAAPAASGGSGGGGGWSSPLWLLGLALAPLVLSWQRRGRG